MASQPVTPHVFHGISFNPTDMTVRRFEQSDLRRELEDPAVFTWIDVQGPDVEPLNEILRLIDIDLVLVGHFSEPEVLPRIVERRDCLAFYVYEVAQPERHLDTTSGLEILDFERMILVMSTDYVITYHQNPLEVVDYVKETCEDSFRLAGKTPGFIVYLLLQRCLYDYGHLNLANDNYLDDLEAGLRGGTHKEVASKVGVASANILTLKKLLASLQIVLMLLGTKRSRFISEQARASFAEMLQTSMATRAALDSSHNLLDGILGGLQTMAANRTSEIARTLTVVSAIILPLTLITGIYGMNFEHMPELKWRAGYYIVFAGMLSIAVTLLIGFRKLGWLAADQDDENG